MPVELRELAGEPSSGRAEHHGALPILKIALGRRDNSGLSVVSALGARGLTLARLIGNLLPMK